MAQADYSKLQRVMDVIGSTPGSILVRGPDRWIALPPGQPGQVLAIGTDGMPYWANPSDLGI